MLLAEALRLAKEGKTQLPRARELYALARPLSDEEMPEELENYILISAENAAAQIEANEAELEQAIAEIDAKIQQIQQNRQMLPMFAQMQGADDGQLQQMLKQVEEEEKKLEQQKTLLETEERKKVEGQKTALTAEANELYRLVRSLRPDWRLPLTFAIYMKKRQALKDAQNDTQMGDNAAKAKDFGQAAALYADAIRKTEEGMRVETVPFRKEQARKQLARLHSLYARSLYRIGRRDEALAAYEKAVGLGAEGLPAGDNLKAMLATRDQAGQLVRDLILKARNENNEVLYDLLVNLVMDFARAKETTDEARNLRRSARWVLGMTLNTDWWDVFTANFEEKAEQWQFVGNALIPSVRNADGTLNPDRAQIALVIAESGIIDGMDESSYLYRNAKALTEGIEMLRTEEETRRTEQVRTRTIENMSAPERNVLVHEIIKRSGLDPAQFGIQAGNRPPVRLTAVPMAEGMHARVFNVLGLNHEMVLKEVVVGQEEAVKKAHRLASGLSEEVLTYAMALNERGHAVEIGGRLYILQVKGMTAKVALEEALDQPDVPEEERIRQAGEIVTHVAEHINRLANDHGVGYATSGLSGSILDDMGYAEEDSERVVNFDFANLDEIGASEEGKRAMEDVWQRLGDDLDQLIEGLPGISEDTKEAFSLHLHSTLMSGASLGETTAARETGFASITPDVSLQVPAETVDAAGNSHRVRVIHAIGANFTGGWNADRGEWEVTRDIERLITAGGGKVNFLSSSLVVDGYPSETYGGFGFMVDQKAAGVRVNHVSAGDSNSNTDYVDGKPVLRAGKAHEVTPDKLIEMIKNGYSRMSELNVSFDRIGPAINGVWYRDESDHGPFDAFTILKALEKQGIQNVPVYRLMADGTFEQVTLNRDMVLDAMDILEKMFDQSHPELMGKLSGNVEAFFNDIEGRSLGSADLNLQRFVAGEEQLLARSTVAPVVETPEEPADAETMEFVNSMLRIPDAESIKNLFKDPMLAGKYSLENLNHPDHQKVIQAVVMLARQMFAQTLSQGGPLSQIFESMDLTDKELIHNIIVADMPEHINAFVSDGVVVINEKLVRSGDIRKIAQAYIHEVAHLFITDRKILDPVDERLKELGLASEPRAASLLFFDEVLAHRVSGDTVNFDEIWDHVMKRLTLLNPGQATALATRVQDTENPCTFLFDNAAQSEIRPFMTKLGSAFELRALPAGMSAADYVKELREKEGLKGSIVVVSKSPVRGLARGKPDEASFAVTYNNSVDRHREVVAMAAIGVAVGQQQFIRSLPGTDLDSNVIVVSETLIATIEGMVASMKMEQEVKQAA